MTQEEDAFHVTGPDGRHQVRPGDPYLMVSVGPIRHKIPSMMALRLGDTLVMAASRALQGPVKPTDDDDIPHGHHWSDTYVQDRRGPSGTGQAVPYADGPDR